MERVDEATFTQTIEAFLLQMDEAAQISGHLEAGGGVCSSQCEYRWM